MRAKPIHVVGAGGHAKVVVRTLLELGYSVQAIFDDDARRWGTQLLGCPICGPVDRIDDASGAAAIVAIGDNATRRAIANRYDLNWVTVVHPSALVDPTVELGAGVVILHRAVVQPDCRIGEHAIVNTAATVDHDCVVGNYAHLAPGTHLAGAVSIGNGVLLGIGAVVAPGKSIGHATVVGAGAVVASDLPSGVVAHGVPARTIRSILAEPALTVLREPIQATRRSA